MTVTPRTTPNSPGAESSGDRRPSVRQEVPVPPGLRELSPMRYPGYVDADRVTLGTFIGYDRRVAG